LRNGGVGYREVVGGAENRQVLPHRADYRPPDFVKWAMPYAVGSVPFLNARPLVARFESLGEDSPVGVVYDWPSRLPSLLESGEADAILVSSLDALTRLDARAAAGVCIGTQGPAQSVRLFSKVPFERIGSLALDASSMTSNALARIVLAERHGIHPSCRPCEPDLQAMLADHDACLLIGDKGLFAEAADLRTLDLGEAWRGLTGLGFVWALWVGGDRLTPELSALLNGAWAWAEGRIEEIADQAAATTGWDRHVCREYLGQVMRYRFDPGLVMGLREFGRLALRHGLVEAARLPELVEAEAPVSV
jgi:chorismate dehydratase